MHTNQTYNSLTIDGPALLKFPSEIVPFIQEHNWDDVVWNTFGLPGFQCKFSLVGDQLYFESDSDGKISVRQSNFTGQALANAVITPKDGDKVFVVTFELTFCLGKLCENEATEFRANARSEYESGFQRFKMTQEKLERIRKTWAFRYLYRPYFHIVRVVTITIIFILQLLSKSAIWCAEKMTPIKL